MKKSVVVAVTVRKETDMASSLTTKHLLFKNHPATKNH